MILNLLSVLSKVWNNHANVMKTLIWPNTVALKHKMMQFWHGMLGMECDFFLNQKLLISNQSDVNSSNISKSIVMSKNVKKGFHVLQISLCIWDLNLAFACSCESYDQREKSTGQYNWIGKRIAFDYYVLIKKNCANILAFGCSILSTFASITSIVLIMN